MFNEIYLDIDDTILDTNGAVTRYLKNKGIDCNELSYRFIGLYDKEISSVLSDYSKIDFLPAAREGIDILREHYKITLVSAYTYEVEGGEKVRFASNLGLPIILCKNRSKVSVDMSNRIFIDDRSDYLRHSNASIKYNMYNRWNTLFEDIPYVNGVFTDWRTLVYTLLGLKE